MIPKPSTTHEPANASHATTPVALVTGAGSGIGRAVCLRLAKLGYHLALVSRTQAHLQTTADLCLTIAPHCQTLILPADIRQSDTPRHLVEQVEQRWQRLDVLMNIAGSAPLMPIEKITPTNLADCLHSNLTGAILLTAATWPIFQRQASGFVGNVSSMSSIDPFAGFSMYAAAKIGLNMFTHCTAQEGKAIHVKAVAVAPGCVETPMLRTNFDESIVAKNQALAPDAIAQVLCDCLTGQRVFESGQTLIVPSDQKPIRAIGFPM